MRLAKYYSGKGRRYSSKANYWEFRPSSMAVKILGLFPPLGRSPKVLEIGCGEGATTVFLAKNEYEPLEAYDIIFSSGTIQYLLPENRKKFIASLKNATNPGGLNVLQTFVISAQIKVADFTPQLGAN